MQRRLSRTGPVTALPQPQRIHLPGFPADGLEPAALDAGSSRIWGGIHYSFDNLAGAELGRQIALLDLESVAFSPVPEPPSLALVLGALALMVTLRRTRRQQIM
jgi:hypothetical protein